jgi:hypothetical protein
MNAPGRVVRKRTPPCHSPIEITEIEKLSEQIIGSATWYTTQVSSTVLTTVLSDPLLL